MHHESHEHRTEYQVGGVTKQSFVTAAHYVHVDGQDEKHLEAVRVVCEDCGNVFRKDGLERHLRVLGSSKISRGKRVSDNFADCVLLFSVGGP